MSRNEAFQQPQDREIYKDLRHNAGEARDYFTGFDPESMRDTEPLGPRSTKGASGESSN